MAVNAHKSDSDACIINVWGCVEIFPMSSLSAVVGPNFIPPLKVIDLGLVVKRLNIQ